MRTLLLTIAAALLPSAIAARAAGAQVPARGDVPVPQEFSTTQDDSLYSVTRSQEDIHELEQARAELQAGNLAAGVDRLHRLLQHETGGVATVAPGRYLSLRLCAVLTLANLSPAGAEAYEQLVEREGGALAGKPVHTLLREQLAVLADRFPTSVAGRRARLRLGDLCLERGDAAGAVAQYRLLLDACAFGSAAEAQAADRLRSADAMQRPLETREKPPTPTAADVLAALPPAGDGAEWPAMGGGPGGTQPMQDPLGRPTPRWTEEMSAPGFEYSAGGNYAMHAVGNLEAVFVNRGVDLIALQPLKQALLWSSPTPLEEGPNAASMREYAQGINAGTVLSAAVAGDVVIAALQVPDNSTNVRFLSNLTIMSKLPDRRLFAFDRHTGKLLWSHFDQIDGPVERRFHGHLVCGPPTIVGDTVYAPVHDRSGAIAFYVGAYDLRTGQPRWRRLICSSQQEVNMFGNSRHEFAASPLCAQGGLVLGSSNLGLCYAVEQATGRIRWITSYDVIRMPPTQLHDQADRLVFFQNSAPVVTDGVVCCTPLDSAFAVAFDVETGKPQWQLPFEARAQGANNVRWLFGAIGDEFLLAGAGVVAVRARGTAPSVRLVRGREFLRGPDDGDCPRPAVSGRWIYYAAPGRLSVFDREGNLATVGADLRLQRPGNLLLVDGIVVSLSNSTFEVAADRAALLARAEQQAQQTPDDPQALLRLCTLHAAFAGDEPAAQDELARLWRRGLDACVKRGLAVEQPPRSVFQRALFEHERALAARGSAADAPAHLRAARELAPDLDGFVRAQAELLAVLASDTEASLRELTLLRERAGDRSGEFFDAGGSVPVAAYVAWRRANLLPEPGQRLLQWQLLLEEHPKAVLQRKEALVLARDAIAALIAQHGTAIYAPVEQRAAADLQSAGDDVQRLRAVGTRYPQAAAAEQARAKLLDLAVAQADLGAAIEVLALTQRTALPAPGLLRRVLEAARRRGNLGLAQALRDRLLATAPDVKSDWPADGGRTFAAIAPELLPTEPIAAPPPMRAPEGIVATIPNPSARTIAKLLPTTIAAGFACPTDAPLYLLTANDKLQLRGIDLIEPRHPALFVRDLDQQPTEHLWLCGTVLIVFHSHQVAAVDYRSGALLWEQPAEGFYECFGVEQGVLLVTHQGNSVASDDPLLLGIEPLTGRTLFERVLPSTEGSAPPKASAGELLRVCTPRDGKPSIERIDPLDGRTRRAVPLTEATLAELHLKPEVLASAMLFPQELFADRAHLFIKVEPPMVDGPPRLLVLNDDGSVAWRWTGSLGCRVIAARRGDRVVIAEGLPLFASQQFSRKNVQNRVLVLNAADGAVLREVALGQELVVRNWQRAKFDTPAPAALLGEDGDPQRGDRRFVCVGVDDGLPTFTEPFGAADDEVVPMALLGRDLVVFCHRPDRGGSPRVFALKLADRTGALASGRKFLRLRSSVTAMAPAGPYTALVGQDGLMLLGPDDDVQPAKDTKK